MSAAENPLTSEYAVEVPLKRPPLVKVLAQVRFQRNLSITNAKEIAPFQKAIRSTYPNLVEEQVHGIEINSQGILPTGEHIWRFGDEEQNWQVSLSTSFIAIDCRRYSSRTNLLERLGFVLEALANVDALAPALVERIGVRYIDRVEGEALKSLAEFIRPELLGVIVAGLPLLEQTVTRSVFGAPQENASLQIRSGWLQKGVTIDPAVVDPIDSESWFLDLDIFRNGQASFDKAEILADISAFAARTYTLFRWAVTPAFLKHYGGNR